MKPYAVVSRTIVLLFLLGIFIMPVQTWALPIPGGSLDPLTIPKYQMPLVIPPAMPKSEKINAKNAKNADYYEIAMRQFQQQILPSSFPKTTVWSYGEINHPWTFNYPAFTIEAKHDKPVRIKWINDLKDPMTGKFLPHLFAVDQTLHWANPPGGVMGRDMHGMDPNRYVGPVPIVTHLHGAHVQAVSDGFPEAWFLPAATNIPAGYATVGSKYDEYKATFKAKYGVEWEPGTAVYQYENDQLATTLWYHDHALGMTRLNVQAGPAGFYLIRGGPGDDVSGLPGPAPAPANSSKIDPTKPIYYEVPIVIQDRSFNTDGSIFYPDNRAFFEGLTKAQLQIPFIPDMACNGQMSDISGIWNPEFFGNTIVVNGRTWPYLQVEQRRYRFRFLNGSDARTYILKTDNNMPFYIIGTDQGFLPATVMQNKLLIAPAERYDVIMDFTNVPKGTNVTMLNFGPEEPFNGTDLPVSDPNSTGQVMQFRVVAAKSLDTTRDPMLLDLPEKYPLGNSTATRQLTLNELESNTVMVSLDPNGNLVLDCTTGLPFGPRQALLGTLADGPLTWDANITELPKVGSTETWEIMNFTVDAHPIHLHLVAFEIVNREGIGGVRPPEPWESGWKDTVIAYPGEITRVRAKFDIAGLYVWHCHILEHEDNEMMRPYRVIP